MDAVDKTKSLIRKDIPVGLLVKNDKNPNKMKPRDFDLLVDNIQKTGITDPILVRPIPKTKTFKIVGGHHRFDAAMYLGFEGVPCTVITDPDFDEEAETFQVVRMNMIRGKMDPAAFFAMYDSLSSKYSDAVLQDAFGFAEEAEFRKMVEQTASTIEDPAMKTRFKEAAKEVKTIDGLARILNELFTKYGDTLPWAFMVFDHGGQRSVWLQVSEKTIKTFDVIGALCQDKDVTVDDVIGGVLQLIAKGDLKDQVMAIIAKAPKVVLPANMQLIPTKQNIASIGELG